jgi:hypothetical protein
MRSRALPSGSSRPHWFNKPEIPTPLLGTSTSWRLTSRQPALQPSQSFIAANDGIPGGRWCVHALLPFIMTAQL